VKKIYNCTILIDSRYTDTLILLAKNVLGNSYFKEYQPRILSVVERLEEETDSVIFQFYLLDNQDPENFQAVDLQSFLAFVRENLPVSFNFFEMLLEEHF
jgi:hypothetical protein